MPVIDARQYGELCDLMWRVSQGWPLDGPGDGFMHTSDTCRAAANQVMDILGFSFPADLSR